MHISENERQNLDTIITKCRDGIPLTKEQRSYIIAFCYNALKLIDKTNELKAYLSLPKFQGIEMTYVQCPKCLDNFTQNISKSTVEVQDIFNRLG